MVLVAYELIERLSGEAVLAVQVEAGSVRFLISLQ